MQYVIALCLLPYIRVTPINSDTQPHAMLALAAVILVFSITTGRLKLYPISVLVSIFFLIVGVYSGETVQGISLAMLPIGIDFISRQKERKILQGAKIALVFLLVGVVVNIVAEGVLVHLVSNFRTGGSRGFNSFASEASFLGLLGLACALIFHILKAGWRWFWLSGMIVFLSGSAIVIFPFILFVVLIYVRGKKLFLVPVVIVVSILGLKFAAEFDSRFGSIARIAIQNHELVFLDVSFSNRVIRSGGPIIAAYESSFVPHGLSTELKLDLTYLSNQADYYVSRLSSPASVLIYGFGFLSLPVLFLYFYNCRGPVELWVVLLFFSIVNISTATPYLWVLYALPWILKRRERESKRRRFSSTNQRQSA